VELEIIYEDDVLVVINKPSGIMVHRTNITEDKIFLLQLLRNQIKQRVYPIHRLDRGTSGVLLFAKSGSIAGLMQDQFRDQSIRKTYQAIIRGYVETGVIDAPLKNKKGVASEAETRYKLISKSEKPFSISRYPNSRYSYVEVNPKSGKYHQIRRHFAHIRHPIIGDKKHGDCKHNKYLNERFGLNRMLLHATEVVFVHPVSNETCMIKVPISPFFEKFKNLLTEN